MIFHATYTYAIEDHDRVHQRFKDTGAIPPEQVSMVGRWHSVGGNRGSLVAETDHPEAMAQWLQGWTDLLDFEVTPVLEDEQFSEVIG